MKPKKFVQLYKRYPKYLPNVIFDGVSDDMLISKEFKTTITCPICITLFDIPLTLLCGHSFCRKCISKCTLCPICKKPFSPEALPEKNITLANLVNSQRVTCPSHIDEATKPCNTTNLTVENILSHVKVCGNITLKCICGKMIPKKDYLKESVECYCELVDCHICLIPQKERLLEFHSELCENTKIKCSNCGNAYVRKSKELHDTRHCTVSCPFNKMGCPAKQLKMKEYQKHIVNAQEKHIALSLKQNYFETYQRILQENTAIAQLPQKLITIWFEYETMRKRRLALPTESIGDVIDDVLKDFNTIVESSTIVCRRKSTEERLRKNWKVSKCHIRNFETLTLTVEGEYDSSAGSVASIETESSSGLEGLEDPWEKVC